MLKSFLPLFAMTFFIVLFIVLMQFLWKFIDDLVGKGLSFSVLSELFFYAAVTLVPMALPLAILLASLMTFGNMGEKSELTAIKASGISLLKVMKPLIVLISLIAIGAFFFQNDVLPKAQVKMYTLLFSVKQKSPEVEIPEGAFYDQIPGYNLYVKSKNKDTGTLYDVMIYDVSHGGDNATILLADSGRLAFTPDNKYLYLHLYTGEQFENLREQRALDRNVPFRRESFLDKQVLIPFDANFSRLDEEGMRRQYVGKNMSELRASIDSLSHRVDSIGKDFSVDLKRNAFPGLIDPEYFPEVATLNKEPYGYSPNTGFSTNPAYPTSPTSSRMHETESADGNQSGRPQASDTEKNEVRTKLNLDSLLEALTPSQRGDVYTRARAITKSRQSEMEFRAMTMDTEKRLVRRHQIELIKKFTLSVACIIFFFIGAPLGAIIRKGGLGTPLVISVLLFLVYYIIDNTGYKMARDGHIPVWIGMWLSTFILLPLGIFVTYKAMNDSAVFNKDVYVNLFRKWFGLREERHVQLKEVIINEISPRHAIGMFARLYSETMVWLRKYGNKGRKLSYKQYWKRGYEYGPIERIASLADRTVAYVSDSRDLKVVVTMENIPVIKPLWIYHPTSKEWLRKLLCWFIPIGGIIYLVSIPYGRRLCKEMQDVAATSRKELTLLRQAYGMDPSMQQSRSK